MALTSLIGLCVNWLLNVTINNISVIHMTAHTCRCAGGLQKKLDSRAGSYTIDISLGYLTCPSNLFLKKFRLNEWNFIYYLTSIDINPLTYHKPTTWTRTRYTFRLNLKDGRTDRQTTDKVIPMCRYDSQATQKLSANQS